MFGQQSCSGPKRPDFFCTIVAVSALFLVQPHPAHAEPRHPSRATVSQSHAVELPKTVLQLGSKKIVAEIAADDATRARGLMFRTHLPPDQGMLFVFQEASQVCCWMKIPLVPLSIAFIDAQAHIINLANMEPQSLDTHCALAPAQYALEMNQGWFAQNGIAPGTKVQGLPVLSR